MGLFVASLQAPDVAFIVLGAVVLAMLILVLVVGTKDGI
jgi:hypothetical protein